MEPLKTCAMHGRANSNNRTETNEALKYCILQFIHFLHLGIVSSNSSHKSWENNLVRKGLQLEIAY